jgi:hypothetical protein
MQAIGLDHRTRELAGLHRSTTANDSIWGTGKETAAVLNTITAGMTIEEIVTSTIMADIVITTTDNMVITTTTGTIDSGLRSEPLCGFGGAGVETSTRGIERPR